jgi:hypothetical protein
MSGSRLWSSQGRVLVIAFLVILAASCSSEGAGPTAPEPLSSPVGAVEPPPSTADEPESSEEAAVPALPAASAALATPPVEAADREHAATDLEGMLPGSVDGVELVRESYTADEFVTEASEDAFATFLQIAGRTREEVTLALAYDPAGGLLGQIRALRATGTDPDVLLEAVLSDDWYASAERAPASMGGRDVTVVTIPTEGGAVTEYLWVHDDVAFVVSGADPDTAARFFEALP